MNVASSAPLASLALALCVAGPTLLAVLRARVAPAAAAREAFLTNDGRTGVLAATASVVCGNVGIGTFVAIYLFTRQQATLGMSVAGAYAVGLLLCAGFAGTIREASRRTGTRGLIDLICVTHGITGGVGAQLLVWAPIALVFLLRTAVQLAGLALVLEAAGVAELPALGLALLACGAYLVVGGYRAATETDLAQAAIVLAVCALLGIAAWTAPGWTTPSWTAPGWAAPDGAGVTKAGWDLTVTPLLVAIWLFIPTSPVLAVDNWQRIATARSTRTARRAYLAGALLCSLVYAVIVLCALVPGDGDGAGADVVAAMHGLMAAAGLPVWSIALLLAACTMSSIDTFAMPLVTSFGRLGWSVTRLRLVLVALFVATGAAALSLRDVLDLVVAAFSSLVVFLPAVWGALYRERGVAAAAYGSLIGGVAISLFLQLVGAEAAAMGGFLAAAALYAGLDAHARRRPA